MPASIKINWYDKDALLQIDGATEEILNRLALWVEAESKKNMNVDTGFMRNSTYTILADDDPDYRGWKSGQYKSRKTGQMVQRNQVGAAPTVPRGAAAVHVAAEYAIYQEMRKASLYPALERARGQAGGIIKEVGRAML